MKITFDVTDALRNLVSVIVGETGLIPEKLDKLQRSVDKIMKSQEEFDAQITEANTKLDDLSTAVTTETDQIKAFIAANPSVNTTGLDGVITRLEGVATSVGTIFEPAVPVPAEG